MEHRAIPPLAGRIGPDAWHLSLDQWRLIGQIKCDLHHRFDILRCQLERVAALLELLIELSYLLAKVVLEFEHPPARLGLALRARSIQATAAPKHRIND